MEVPRTFVSLSGRFRFSTDRAFLEKGRRILEATMWKISSVPRKKIDGKWDRSLIPSSQTITLAP